MIGFDSIGSAAIGEQTADAPDVIIFAPGSSASASTSAPIIAAGASVFAGAKVATATVSAPSVRVGVQIVAGSMLATSTPAAGDVRISATVSSTGIEAIASLAAPGIGAGASIQASAQAATSSIVPPFVTAGKSVLPGSLVANAVAAAPKISISAAIRPPGLNASVSLAAPQIFGGNYIEATNTVTMITPYGEIGSSSIGQFSIGEGEVSTRIVRIGIIASCSLMPPFISAGKSIFPGGKGATASLGRPEIDSRARKLRIIAIAS